MTDKNTEPVQSEPLLAQELRRLGVDEKHLPQHPVLDRVAHAHAKKSTKK